MICNCYALWKSLMLIRLLLTEVSEWMIIYREGPLWSQKYWHISVVSCRDSLPVQCLLNEAVNITLGWANTSLLVFLSFHGLNFTRWGSLVHLRVETVGRETCCADRVEGRLLNCVGVQLAIGMTVFIWDLTHQLRFTLFKVAFLFTILLLLFGRYFHMR